jgi:hypothetical protein
MRKIRGTILAGALVLVANAVALTGVLYNRSGEPEAILVLTERELPLQSLHRESTGVSLRLEWGTLTADGPEEERRRFIPGRRAEWFDQEKLEALGFDCSVDLDHPDAEAFYRKALPMETYVVLEYGGLAWREHISRLEDRAVSEAQEEEREVEGHPGEATETVRLAEHTDSRLFAVDVGNDPLQLRERYPDRSRLLVARAAVDLVFLRDWEDETESWRNPRLGGAIRHLTAGEIHVPAGISAPLSNLPKRAAGTPPPPGAWVEEGPPRYEVTLHYGKRLEPWVESVRLIEAVP